ncbi:transporter [Lithospermum erythrorhizon]|uniref:Transporter n=1 Tax=Lithospermum erythrorhizon TaxID=34254 RepID=A0AAV3PMZ5_LITER
MPLSGSLPDNPAHNNLHYHIPYSFGVAASTLVANELGAGNPLRAKVALYEVLVLFASEFLIASIAIYICRGMLAYGFSNEIEVVNYVKHITPLICLSIIMDSVRAVLSRVVRGSGWKRIGAYVNLGSYYLVGILVAIILGFLLNLRGQGLWGGLVSGTMVQSILLSLITSLTNFGEQAMKTRQRMVVEKLDTRTKLLK